MTKITDGGGLILEVPQSGSKRWRLRYRFGGKEKMLALGTYPMVSLKDARAKALEAKEQIANNIDPSFTRQQENLAQSQISERNFEAIARDWHTRNKAKWTEQHGARILRRLENDIFPYIGKRAIEQITPPELLSVLRKLKSRGAIDIAHRLKGHVDRCLDTPLLTDSQVETQTKTLKAH